MDGKKKYAAVSIRRREGEPAKGASAHVQMQMQIGPVKVVLSTEAPFAEIEYEHRAGGVPTPAPAPAQPIGQRTVDPARERFYQMRSLASGAPFARNDPGLFYKQAKYMEDFTDDYRGNAHFFMYYPTYQHMGYDQLRTYFTWRTRMRQGERRPVSLSYIFLYIYELLCGIGAQDPADGLERLVAVWKAYPEHDKALGGYLPRWVKDYHIYYPMPRSFADFAREHGLQRHYLDVLALGGHGEDSFAFFSALSSYDVAKSKFLQAGNDGLMRDCFAAVLDGVEALCARRNACLEDLLISSMRKGRPWHPFQRALFHPWLTQSDRQVALTGREIYTCKNNRWTADIPERYPDRREIVGYLMKKTEACLRQAARFKFKITANPRAFCNLDLKLRPLNLTLAELDAAIEKAVADFYRGLTRTVVVVDGDNLNRIRREALHTQDKLIVPEDYMPPPAPMAQAEASPPPPAATPPEPSGGDTGGWTALGDALSGTERGALRMILAGGADIRAYADASGVMLEVLADSINEKAMDCVGDSILELTDSMVLYDEYRENIAEMMEQIGN